MQKCSVCFILDLKCDAGKKDVFRKIDSDDLTIGQVELLQIRSIELNKIKFNLNK